jgi:hypothetical protein
LKSGNFAVKIAKNTLKSAVFDQIFSRNFIENAIFEIGNDIF